MKALFIEVCDLPSRAAAAARLAELNASAPECAAVLALLAHDDGHTTYLSGPVRHVAASAVGGELAPGDSLGAWTLVRELGEGGMGRVFEAQRSDGLYRQRAAIKLLRGFSGAGALQQLAHERQVLASLNHPHIARLLDGGTTPAGNPYLVMDYVDGVRIDQHVRQRGLDLEATLALFLMVCEAVAYAHRRQVVHCDIKPGNVLVDGEGHAKLLDFGIAQLQGHTDGEAGPAGPASGETTHPLRGLTPRYASPEQRAGQAATAASDVYSLGRLLESLLALVQERDPLRPADPGLQAVVAAATADLPDTRTPDVRTLVNDLQRLQDRRERDAAIAARQLAQQEAAAKGQVTDFVVSLFRAADPNAEGHPDMKVSEILARGRARIDTELQGQPPLQAELKFVLAGIFHNLGQPDQSLALYEQALALERTLVPQRPARLSRLLVLHAQTLAEEGYREQALGPAREALAVLEAWAEAPTQQRASVLSILGWIEGGVGRFDEGRRHLHQALALMEGELGTLHRLPAVARHNLGQLELRAGRFEQAEHELRRALEAMREVPSLPVGVRLVTQEAWAVSLTYVQRAPEALAPMEEAVTQVRALHGLRSTRLARCLDQYSTVLRGSGRPAEALAAADEAVAITRAESPASPNLARFLFSRAQALAALGDAAASAALAEAKAVRDAHPRMDVWVAAAIDDACGRSAPGVARDRTPDKP